MNSIDWYKTLDLHQKVNLKSIFNLLCGLSWSDISCLFSMREKIDIVYNKLKMEGFDIP